MLLNSIRRGCACPTSIEFTKRVIERGVGSVMLKVKDWSRAKQYYTSALKPLGYELIADWGNGGGFGFPAEKNGGTYVEQDVNVVRSSLPSYRDPRRAKPVFSSRFQRLMLVFESGAESEPGRIRMALASPTEQALRDLSCSCCQKFDSIRYV